MPKKKAKANENEDLVKEDFEKMKKIEKVTVKKDVTLNLTDG